MIVFFQPPNLLLDCFWSSVPDPVPHSNGVLKMVTRPSLLAGAVSPPEGMREEQSQQ